MEQTAAQDRERPVERLLVRVAEAAEMTGVGRATAYELVAKGEWPSVSIGRSVRIPLADLREWIEARKRPGTVGGAA